MRGFINAKAKDLRQGAIRAMFDKAGGMENVISMGIGEPDQPTSKAICEAAAKAMYNGETHYTPNAGLIGLRETIAAHCKKKGVQYKAAGEIIVTNGGMGALSLALQVVLNPGDEVLIQDPQWLNYVAQVQYCDGCVMRVPTLPEDGFALRADAIESCITPRTKVLMVNSPNNPTGRVLSRAELEQIAEVAIKHDLLVLSDEVYDTLNYDGVEVVSIASLPGMKERTLMINSCSKAFAMTGWRIGYAAGPLSIIDRMTKVQENFSACANVIGQHAAIYALENPELSGALRGIFEKRRALALERVAALPGFSIVPPKGAFYLFPDIRALGLDSATFCNRLLDEKAVVCIPGSAFGTCGEGFIRMAYTDSEERLSEAFDRIQDFCRSL